MKGQKRVWGLTVVFLKAWASVSTHQLRKETLQNLQNLQIFSKEVFTEKTFVICNFPLAERLYSLCLIAFDIRCITDQPLEECEQDLLKKHQVWVWILDLPLLMVFSNHIIHCHFSLYLLLAAALQTWAAWSSVWQQPDLVAWSVRGGNGGGGWS